MARKFGDEIISEKIVYGKYAANSRKYFIPNKKGPSWFCWVFHSFWWVDNYPQWINTCRHSYEVRCNKCGACWERKFERKN